MQTQVKFPLKATQCVSLAVVMNGKVTAGAAAGAVRGRGTGTAPFPGKVSTLLLLHLESRIRKLLGTAGKTIPEQSRHLIAVAQTQGLWEPSRVRASTPHPGRARGLWDQHIRPHAAGTGQKQLQTQQSVSKEPCFASARLVKKNHCRHSHYPEHGGGSAPEPASSERWARKQVLVIWGQMFPISCPGLCPCRRTPACWEKASL